MPPCDCVGKKSDSAQQRTPPPGHPGRRPWSGPASCSVFKDVDGFPESPGITCLTGQPTLHLEPVVAASEVGLSSAPPRSKPSLRTRPWRGDKTTRATTAGTRRGACGKRRTRTTSPRSQPPRLLWLQGSRNLPWCWLVPLATMHAAVRNPSYSGPTNGRCGNFFQTQSHGGPQRRPRPQQLASHLAFLLLCQHAPTSLRIPTGKREAAAQTSTAVTAAVRPRLSPPRPTPVAALPRRHPPASGRVSNCDP